MWILFIILFIISSLFINASHIIPWFFGGQKPNHFYWKIYAIIGIIIYILIFILANKIL